MNADDNSAETASAVSTDKAVQLFTYLRELCALRSSHVRDVSQYDEVFWFGDIPREKLCQCIGWRIGEAQDDLGEEPSDLWVEVHKPVLKAPPEVPDELEQWIKADEVTDSSLDEPGLFSEIPVTVDDDQAIPSHTEILKLDDCPEVFELWMTYVENEWKPWAEQDRRLQLVQNAYNQLFAIYQRQEKLGEQYEVVVGVGLLSWQSPASGAIRRHVVSLQTRVEFDRFRGIMIVRAGSDGPKPMFECEMLETSDRPGVSDNEAIVAAVNDLDGDPWAGPQMEAALKIVANTLPTPEGATGRYDPALENRPSPSAAPVISLSPAVILRRHARRR